MDRSPAHKFVHTESSRSNFSRASIVYSACTLCWIKHRIAFRENVGKFQKPRATPPRLFWSLQSRILSGKSDPLSQVVIASWTIHSVLFYFQTTCLEGVFWKLGKAWTLFTGDESFFENLFRVSRCGKVLWKQGFWWLVLCLNRLCCHWERFLFFFIGNIPLTCARWISSVACTRLLPVWSCSGRLTTTVNGVFGMPM